MAHSRLFHIFKRRRGPQTSWGSGKTLPLLPFRRAS